jgi:hypothetical protein
MIFKMILIGATLTAGTGAALAQDACKQKYVCQAYCFYDDSSKNPQKELVLAEDQDVVMAYGKLKKVCNDLDNDHSGRFYSIPYKSTPVIEDFCKLQYK